MTPSGLGAGSFDGTNQHDYDVVIVGGGAAGLNGALMLGRARRSVLVVDEGTPRNAPAAHLHGFLSRDGMAPGDLLAAGRDEVRGYGVEVISGTAVSAVRAPGGFAVDVGGGRTVRARRLLVTTGLTDELPAVPGVRERWGRDVLHCPYCHGWEVRDQPIGILATNAMAVHQALLFRQWSPTVTLFVNTADALVPAEAASDTADALVPAEAASNTAALNTAATRPTAAEYAQLAARGITVVDGEVDSLEVTDDELTGVRLRDGAVHPVRAVVVMPYFAARADLLGTLGVGVATLSREEYVVAEYVPADDSGLTEVPGVWVAGNVADPMLQVLGAAASGAKAAVAINADLVAEDVRQAVEAAAVPAESA